jgi:hypothetical protein
MNQLRIMLILLVMGCLNQPLFAHGGGIPQIANAPIGQYTISVWTDPAPLRVGTVHVTVGLAQENEAVLNRQIQVTLAPVAGGQPIEARATHENSANKFLYEADLAIDRPGDYRITVQVDNLADSVSFIDTVTGASLTTNPFVIGGIVLLVAVVALVGLKRGRDAE